MTSTSRQLIALALALGVTGCTSPAASPPPPAPTVNACTSEDGSTDTLPCRWDASTEGNGVGRSFWILATADGGVDFAYDDGEVDHEPIRP